MLGTAVCLTGLGVSALEAGDSERAAVLCDEDLSLLRHLRDKTGTSYGLQGMAALRGTLPAPPDCGGPMRPCGRL